MSVLRGILFGGNNAVQKARYGNQAIPSVREELIAGLEMILAYTAVEVVLRK